jgi:vancomycin resistance protein YoaR
MRLWPRRQVYVDNLPRTHDVRFAALFLMLFAGLLGLLYAVGFFVAGDRLPRGTTVAGVDVGGMQRGEARSELQDALIPRLEQPITAHVLTESFQIDPQLAGMTFDLEATLSEGLAGERWDPRHMLKVVMGGGPLPPIVDVDQQELDDTLERIAAKIERSPVEASVSLVGGKPAAKPGEEGVVLDYGGAGDVLEQALLDGDDEVELPTETVDPEITTTEATAFADNVAARAVARAVRVRAADTVLTVEPRVFAPALTTEVVDGKLALGVNSAVLASRSHQLMASLPHHPVNAKVSFSDGHPVVIPGRSGARVLAADWADAVLRAAQRSGDSRVANAVVTPDPPDFTTNEARNLEIKERTSSAQVRIAAAAVPETRSIAARLDGALIRPDATFSYHERVGSAETDGASATASAAFEAAFRGGMSNLERAAPQVHLTGAEAGLDARVGSGVDLAWRNATPYGVYLRAWVSASKSGPGQLTVQMWSTRYWRVTVSSSARYNVVQPQVRRAGGRGCRPEAGAEGFAIDVRRTFRGSGSSARVETVHSDYAAVDTVICRRR